MYPNYHYPGKGNWFFENVKANARVYRYEVDEAIELVLTGQVLLGLDSDHYPVVRGFCEKVLHPLMAASYDGSVAEVMRVIDFAMKGEFHHMHGWLKNQAYFVDGRDAKLQEGIRTFFYMHDEALRSFIEDPTPISRYEVFEDDEIPF